MREVEKVLEAANLVVQQVTTENDIGRDAYIDVVDGDEVTGGVVALQVKSGASFKVGEVWLIPGDPADFTLWRESTVPMYGVVHDPSTGALRWVDLCEAAEWDAAGGAPGADQVVSGPYGKRCVVAPETNRLDHAMEPFLAAVNDAVRRRPGLPARGLLSDDLAVVDQAVQDSFAIGRRDPHALLLLAALQSHLPTANVRRAIIVLAMATNHPDIFWTSFNWIPSHVKRAVQLRCRWTSDDLKVLLQAVDVDDDGIGRGTFGQTAMWVLMLDRRLRQKLRNLAVDVRQDSRDRFWAAAIFLYMAGDDAALLLTGLLTDAPDLARDPHFKEVQVVIADWGYLDFF